MQRSGLCCAATTSSAPSTTLTRRRLMEASATALGLTSLAAASGGVVGLSRGAVFAQDGPDSPALTEPPLRASQNGLLETTLEARPHVEAGPGRLVYEDNLPGPTLRVRPGDTLRVVEVVE
jgi:FtsP/CotA-like multicopper oxidase with cupredoxin domain